MKCPKTIFVQKQGNPGDKFLNAQENAKELDDGEIAVYELKETVKKTTKIILS
ncbi:MAG: hypothetical protein AABY22_23610 [Nanoarchaeota archaeon]